MHRVVAVLVGVGALAACGGSTFVEVVGDAGGDGGSSTGGGTSSGGGSTSGASSGGSSGGGSSGGGSGASSSSGAGSSGAGSSSGGGGPCPAQAPAGGASCAPDGRQCEYGTSIIQGCNVLATCSQSRWSVAGPQPNNCTSLPAPGCPVTIDRVMQGSSCTTSGLICDYPRGRCVCQTYLGGPVVLLDGSVQPVWQCQSPMTGCPTPRALLGTACAQEGLVCDYGACNIPGGTAEQCTGGTWVETQVPCPLVAGAKN